MVERPFWRSRIESAWRKAPIVWLTGVRRIGKTTLAREIAHARLVNCDLPSSARALEDPEDFLRSIKERVLILDEVHRLVDPSRVLKIAADEFPALRVLATGSSTLAATTKFRDALTGRKRVVHLVPVLAAELRAFGIARIEDRLLRGGLPASLLSDELDRPSFSEWLDSYYARDVQELFRVEKRKGFLLLLETLLRNNGGLFNASSVATACELSRPTLAVYLDVLEVTHAIRILRPFHGGGSQELVRQPKIYGFDTGFVAHARGWDSLRPEDCGPLWENLVLEHLLAQPGEPTIHFWRDKSQHEVDFVIPRGRGACDAIECKWDAREFSTRSLAAFRALHPTGRNFVVSPKSELTRTRTINGLAVTFTGLEDSEDAVLRY